MLCVGWRDSRVRVLRLSVGSSGGRGAFRMSAGPWRCNVCKTFVDDSKPR